jgi:hypothetical protein
VGRRNAIQYIGHTYYAPVALSESANRKSEITFRDDPFMFFSDALDAVARNIGISLRNRNEMTNFIGARG